MDATKIWLKLYASAPLPDGPVFIAVLHDFIRRQELDELMVDVVDYGHVQDGPRVLFVGHEGNYAIDHGEGRPGLAYQRKRARTTGDGSFAASLVDSLRRTLDIAARLQKEATLASFQLGTGEIVLRIADRLRAPNTASSFELVKADLEAAARQLWGDGATVTYEPGDGAGLFAARLHAPAGATAPSIGELLARVSK